MSSLRKELSEDPLSLFVSSAEAEDISNRAKQSAAIVSQKYAQTMSRIGVSASDLLTESLSFGDPLSRPSNTSNAIKSLQRDHENARQQTISNPSREDFLSKSHQPNYTGNSINCLSLFMWVMSRNFVMINVRLRAKSDEALWHPSIPFLRPTHSFLFLLLTHLNYHP